MKKFVTYPYWDDKSQCAIAVDGEGGPVYINNTCHWPKEKAQAMVDKLNNSTLMSRLVDMKNGERLEAVYPPVSGCAGRFNKDVYALVEQVQQEHDDTPIDLAWVDTLTGLCDRREDSEVVSWHFTSQKGVTNRRLDHLEWNFSANGLHIFLSSMFGGAARPIKTRGQFYTLMRGLGYTL